MQPIDDKITLYNKLIERCKSNNREAQYKLYSLLSGKMFAVCMRYAKNREEAEDLLQDGFVKVFNNIDKFRNEGSFEGWVRRIIVNTAIEEYRKSSKMYPMTNVEDSHIELFWEESSKDLELEDLLKLINSLSIGYRTVFNLYVIEGYAHKEIAKMLNITEGTSKSQLARARYLLIEMVRKSEIVKINATKTK